MISISFENGIKLIFTTLICNMYIACCIVCMHAQEPSFIARIFQYWKQALPEVKNGPAEEKRKFTNQKTSGATFSVRIKEIIVMSISACKTASYILFLYSTKKWFSNKFNNLGVGAP